MNNLNITKQILLVFFLCGLFNTNTLFAQGQMPLNTLDHLQGTWQNVGDPTDRFEVNGDKFTNLKTNQTKTIRTYAGAAITPTTFPQTSPMGTYIYRGDGTYNQNGHPTFSPTDAAAVWQFMQRQPEMLYLELTPMGVNGNPANGIQMAMYELIGAKMPASNKSYYITSASNNKLVDLFGAQAHNGANIHQWDNIAYPVQKYLLKDAGQGYHYLENAVVHKAITLQSGTPSENANLESRQYAQLDSQQFQLIDAGGGSFYIACKTNPEYVVTVQNNSNDNGANVVVAKNTYSITQRFRFIE